MGRMIKAKKIYLPTPGKLVAANSLNTKVGRIPGDEKWKMAV